MQEKEVTSAHLIRRGWEFFPAGVNYLIIGLFLLAGLVLGVQQIFFAADNQTIRHTQQTQKARNDIVQNSSNVQQGYVEAISTDVATIDSYIAESVGAPNRALMISAAVGYGNQACLEATHLTGSYGVSQQMQDWIDTNCSGGALRLDSPIRTGKGN